MTSRTRRQEESPALDETLSHTSAAVPQVMLGDLYKAKATVRASGQVRSEYTTNGTAAHPRPESLGLISAAEPIADRLFVSRQAPSSGNKSTKRLRCSRESWRPSIPPRRSRCSPTICRIASFGILLCCHVVAPGYFVLNPPTTRLWPSPNRLYDSYWTNSSKQGRSGSTAVVLLMLPSP